MCGSRSITERALDICFPVVFKSTLESPSGLVPGNIAYWTSVRETRRELLEHTFNNTIFDWLYACADTQVMASDPRDYIYAVLSISKETRTGLAQIIPDYTKSAKTVFEETNTVMMDVKDREGCALCNKVMELDLHKTRTINRWLRKTIGQDVHIGWRDRRGYGWCEPCETRLAVDAVERWSRRRRRSPCPESKESTG